MSTPPLSAPPAGPPRAIGRAVVRVRRWRAEVLLPVAIAMVTITGALFTYLAIKQESTAVDQDRLAVVQSVQVQSRLTGAQAQTRAFGGLAAQYRAMLAEADALAPTDPERARLMQALAQSFGTRALIYQFMSGTGSNARFDYDLAMQSALHNNDSVALPENQPDLTAATADRYHARGRMLSLSVVVTLAVVVVLMLARLSRRRLGRVAFSVVAGAGYAAALILALPNIW